MEEYRYDDIGRTYEMNALRGIAERSYTYSIEDHLLAAGDATYEYDLDGYLTAKHVGGETTQYTYSSRGELLNVTLPDGTLIEHVHGPMGQRIAKKVDGAIVEKYLWQGLTRLLAVYDGSDNLLMRFTYADARMPVAMQQEGATYYLTYDQVGSLRGVVDAAGNVVKQVDYDAFGNILNDTDPLFEMPFGFAGGLHDRDTGLVRFGYRDYDPDIGHWTAKDPIGFGGGDVDLYGYAQNNPVNAIDPYGLDGGVISGPAAVYGAIAAGSAATLWWATHKDQMARDLRSFWDWLWNENTEENENNTDINTSSCPIPGVTEGRKTKGRSKLFDKPGDMETADSDFDSLSPTDVREIPNGGRIGVLPDGRRINVRPNSTDGRPTIEIQHGKNKIKVRYGDIF